MPPSVNSVWRGGRRGWYKSGIYKAWITQSDYALESQFKSLGRKPRFKGDVDITLRLGPRDRRRDIDNCATAPLDLLERHRIIDNDSQVIKLTIFWDSSVNGCQIDIKKEGTHVVGKASRKKEHTGRSAIP